MCGVNPPQAPTISVDDELDADRFLKDMQVMDINEPKKSCQEQRSCNINNFFSPPYSDNKGKKYCHCYAGKIPLVSLVLYYS
jgi:hypothetical protein